MQGWCGRIKPFENTTHVAHVHHRLEDRPGLLMARFVVALGGEIARRKAICNAVGAMTR